MVARVTQNIAKSVAAASVALLLSSHPASAALDEDTYHAGVEATIEASGLHDQSAQEIVRLLKDKILPDVEAKLKDHYKEDGSTYPDSVVKELNTVKTELEALSKEARNGSTSNVKSMASGIEQQINALKANLNFD
jgi:hypothetical protein